MQAKMFPDGVKEMRLFFDWLIDNGLSRCYSFNGWAILKTGITVRIGDIVTHE